MADTQPTTDTPDGQNPSSPEKNTDGATPPAVPNRKRRSSMRKVVNVFRASSRLRGKPSIQEIITEEESGEIPDSTEKTVVQNKSNSLRRTKTKSFLITGKKKKAQKLLVPKKEKQEEEIVKNEVSEECFPDTITKCFETIDTSVKEDDFMADIEQEEDTAEDSMVKFVMQEIEGGFFVGPALR
ncbi:uncharacterized protein LOC120340129 [Styela clava]|uniref:uncharacterized protein LOC120340129 n=1 Tax=Styela clava TaxID=7725 RepID=UPI0019398DD9|nr:uncharacterized protein LOC120340129 [Styela clava]